MFFRNINAIFAYMLIAVKTIMKYIRMLIAYILTLIEIKTTATKVALALKQEVQTAKVKDYPAKNISQGEKYPWGKQQTYILQKD